MKRSAPAAIVSLAVAISAQPGSALAQQNDQEANGSSASPIVLEAYALPTDASISLDGRLMEDVWLDAIAITDFTQQEPVEGGVPSERTEVRVIFDEDNLYIGAIIFDDPEGVLAQQRERDAFLTTDDRFMWILDTFKDGRTGYSFEINPAGLMGDGILRSSSGGGGGGSFGGFSGGGFGGSNKAWDGIWEARTSMRPDGWSAEIRIPFRTLNFNPDLDEWGINFQRTIRRKNEEILWRGYLRREGLNNPIYAGTLRGLRGMSQGLGLEARPSTIASWQNFLTDSDPTVTPRDRTTNWPKDVSLDLNYSVTSSLRASFSLNTDFAEVESDQRRVNLTRFPLRFPERRDFFLEGSSVFSYSSGPSPFYSRNIGLTSGQQVPIEYGTRVTGQIADYEVGFYQIGTGKHRFFNAFSGLEETIQRESFTVGRVKKRILEQSTIGLIYTRRSASPDSTGFAPEVGQTAGVDLALNSRRFLGSLNVEAQAFLVWNSNPDPTVDRSFADLTARGVRASFPNDIWSGHVSYREFGNAYDPTLGFVTRNNFRRLETRVGWSPRPSISWIRSLSFHTQLRNQWQLVDGDFWRTGITEEQELQIKALGINFESGDGFDVDLTRSREYLERDFPVSRDPVRPVTIPGLATYAWWETRITARTAGRRKVSGYLGASFGDFWNGERLSYGGRLSFRPRPGYSLSTNVQVNDVSMPSTLCVTTEPTCDFKASVYEIEGQWTPTPWVSFTNQLQYDDQSDLVGLFARMRWIVKPGNDIYVVYTHNWRDLGGDLFDPQTRDLVMLSRGASIKMNYTYRF